MIIIIIIICQGESQGDGINIAAGKREFSVVYLSLAALGHRSERVVVGLMARPQRSARSTALVMRLMVVKCRRVLM